MKTLGLPPRTRTSWQSGWPAKKACWWGFQRAQAWQARLQIARQLPRSEKAVIVTILPDSGDKYLSERFWEE